MSVEASNGCSGAVFPSAKGSYVLVLWLVAPQILSVGRLGQLNFQAGYYLYVGSAFGAGGLGGRLKHHLNPSKYHWHVDYLRGVARLQEVWCRVDTRRQECHWAMELASLPWLSYSQPGFGSTDCHCVAHLLYCASADELSAARSAVEANWQLWRVTRVG
ncbi:MAG: GIY-YIG nuclease family protein [Anaerolineales bacterium]|nr:GIY-YIG nuclease family protein [Anaerolineales bacterium]MCS7247713.1 GIY-YIG nuclease family protein [Anaerolineales bacterium]MDW8161523.1 GIY-YIG nuclease family protein [Anaerolineales bacterium]MDW8446859.1 GIY-YIG nuclease family protein [Anaerolineales bacterium]